MTRFSRKCIISVLHIKKKTYREDMIKLTSGLFIKTDDNTTKVWLKCFSTTEMQKQKKNMCDEKQKKDVAASGFSWLDEDALSCSSYLPWKIPRTFQVPPRPLIIIIAVCSPFHDKKKRKSCWNNCYYANLGQLRKCFETIQCLISHLFVINNILLCIIYAMLPYCKNPFFLFITGN